MVLPLLAALGGGSGVASLLGGLFGGRKKAKAPGVDYAKLRDDAIKGGFNPLTALMAGGGSGYQREFAPTMSSGQFVADAIGRVVDTGFNRAGGDDPQAKSLMALDRFKSAQHSSNVNRVPGRFG